MPFAQRFLSIIHAGLLLCTLAVFSAPSVQAQPGGGGGGGGGGNQDPLACSISPADGSATNGVAITFTASTTGGKGGKSYNWDFNDGPGSPSSSTANPVDVTYTTNGTFDVLLAVSDKSGSANCQTTVTVGPGGTNSPPTAVNDSYNATTGVQLSVAAPGVLGNDTDDGLIQALSAVLVSNVSNGSLSLLSDGSFTYTSDPGFAGDDTFTYDADDGEFQDTATVTITVADVPPPSAFPNQTDFKIMMNYELGMHCTGFEFAYCCVLPVYNSILAQVVKPNKVAPQDGGDFPILLDATKSEGLDALGRQTVLRDHELDGSGNFKKYVLKYWHDAQDRTGDPNGKVQTSTLISAVEGNSLQAWNTVFDSPAQNADGTFVIGSYNGSDGVVLGDDCPSGDITSCTPNDNTDNYQNAIWSHLYFYEDLEGSNTSGTSADNKKIRLGVSNQVNGAFAEVAFPPDCGPAFHPMGPDTQGGDPSNPVTANDCGGFSNGNVLTYSGEHGTVVFTQMGVLENLPVMLTSPDIWEALGLPLTPFEDSIGFFNDPGLVDEDSVRPYVAMKAQMYHYDGGSNSSPVLDSNGDPVIGFGTAPIDIPNCERCHSNGPAAVNTPNSDPGQWSLVQAEYDFWMAYYPGMQTGSDWYARLKSAAISMLNGHDVQHGTSFAANYPGCGSLADPNDTTGCGTTPQNTRLGHESIICQKCHADNVIAVVKSATYQGNVIPPVTEAIHTNHREVSEGGPIAFGDSQGRSGGCQGCHPAHRSSGDMTNYPITLGGENFYAGMDNRDANGGCFVGRDVHSNPNKDSDGAETPEHLNPMGEWLSDNVFNDGNSSNGGLWCTNCHQQLGQELWKAENVDSLVHAQPGDPGHVREPGVGATLADVASNLGISLAQAESWLDPRDPAIAPLTASGLPRTADETHTIWKANPGLCDYVAGYFGIDDPDNPGSPYPVNPAHDGNVATVEVNVNSAAACSTGAGTGLIDCGAEITGAPAFHICGTYDGDSTNGGLGDFTVSLPGVNVPQSPFCTTPDCVTAAQGTLPAGSVAVPVPFSAATDGRDHWLSAGEPHCADCHAAPYVEQSGNINAFPPFNYPQKASLMRYSRGHQDISCQGCHESIHGLYPVTPDIDTTSYAQAASLNADDSHGPLKCGTCHEVDQNGIPTWMQGVKYNGSRIRTYDDAVSWAHTFTAEVNPLDDGGVCQNCHQDRASKISETSGKWLRHSFVGRIGRQIQDKAEIAALGDVAGGGYVDADDLAGLTGSVCTSCHTLQNGPSGNFVTLATCNNPTFKSHVIDGRLSEKVWTYVAKKQNSGSTCGW
jgi:hypothetical protein